MGDFAVVLCPSLPEQRRLTLWYEFTPCADDGSDPNKRQHRVSHRGTGTCLLAFPMDGEQALGTSPATQAVIIESTCAEAGSHVQQDDDFHQGAR